jgi:hypothetical protein
MKVDGGGNFLDRINKIKMILEAGDFSSANPINHINPILKILIIFRRI